MASLYVKNVPEDLLRQVRATVALRGESMRALVIRAVETELARLAIELPDVDQN